MRFVELEIENFLSFGTKQVVRLERRGLVAVFGQNSDSGNADSNGAGKSAVMEALVWCLWGETLRGLKGDEVVNQRVGHGCRVSLLIEDDGHTYRVTRTRGTRAVKKPNDLILEVDSGPPAPTSGGTVDDTQDLINTILGMTLRTCTQSVLLGCVTKPFSELTDGAQKEVLEDILQIDAFARARDAVSQRLRDKQNLLGAARMEIQEITSQIEGVTLRRTKLEESQNQHGAILEQRRRELVRRKLDCEAKIEEQWAYDGLDRLIAESRDVEEALIATQRADDEMGSKVVSIMREAAQIKTELERRLAHLEAERAGLESKCSGVGALAGQVCPTCQQPVTVDFADHTIPLWDQAIKDIDARTLQIDHELSKTQTSEEEATQALSTQRNEGRTRIASLQERSRVLFGRVHARQAALQLIQQLEQQAMHLDQEIENLDADENPYGPLVRDARAEEDALVERKLRLAYRERSLDLEVRHLLFWDRGFGNQGLKSYVIEGSLPFLNERAQHYADIMSGGDLRITFSAQRQLKSGEMREKFEVSVINRQGADVYKGNSAGERRRSDIAVGWALGDLAATRAKKPIRFKGLDEPFESLDETGEDAVIRLLHAVLPQYETIFCITHSDHLRNQFPSVMTILKEGGCSRIAS